MWWNCLKSHGSSFLLILAIDLRFNLGRWFVNEKSIKERLGVICKTHRGIALKLSWDSRARLLRSLKCFSCREVNLDQGDDLIPGSRIHKKQRRDQERQHRGRQQQQTTATAATAVANGSSSRKDSVIFKKPFRGYAKTLRGSVVTASPCLG